MTMRALQMILLRRIVIVTDIAGNYCHLVKATEVTAGLPESNGSLLPGLWRDSLHFTCGLTACTPGSAPGPALGNEYGETLAFLPLWPNMANEIGEQCA